VSAPVPEIPSDELTPLIARAVDLGHAGMALIDELRTEDGTGATLPESTVVRLHFVAASTFQSGLLCLWMPETSLASYGLIRGLLEVWSHLIFISDDSQGGDARCRALRYERGTLREWSATIVKAPGYLNLATWQERHDERARDIEQMWKECGCTGQPRTRKHVDATLRAMAKEPTMEWIPGVWSASSASTHAFGVDFLLHSRDDETRLVWALSTQRASWFSFLVATYDYLTVTGATILAKGDQRIAAFQATAGALLKDEYLARVAHGDFDG
jgi:hypothetical protein